MTKNINQIVILFFLCSLCSQFAIAASDNFTPEFFGAKGDGVNDDSYAFSECLKTGKTIWLNRGKTYRLESRIVTKVLSHLVIKGNDAKIVISAKYPLTKSDRIFSVEGNDNAKVKLDVSNIEIICELGQKFEDRNELGDTYMFSVSNGGQIKMRNVKFETSGYYNNVSFLVSTGNNILIENCDIKLNTLSRQGGILWLMNKTEYECDVKLKNCRFEYESQDECMCFATARRNNLERCFFNVAVNDCVFYSKGKCNSSGFIIVYNHSNGVVADFDVKYNNTKFYSSGNYLRHIQTYQCGTDSTKNYGRFLTSYKKCLFDFSTNEITEGGIIGLLPNKSNGVSFSDVGYSFSSCTFNVKNIDLLIGDKDGNRKGFYEFKKCDIHSNRGLFLKKYNSGMGNIEIVLNNTKCQSMDEMVTKEKLTNRRSFYNGKKL